MLRKNTGLGISQILPKSDRVYVGENRIINPEHTQNSQKLTKMPTLLPSVWDIGEKLGKC